MIQINVLNKIIVQITYFCLYKDNTSKIPYFASVINLKLDNVTITENDIAQKLETLNSSKSPGPDQIHPKILSELSNELDIFFS